MRLRLPPFSALLIGFALLGALALAACGGNDNDNKQSTPSGGDAAAATATRPPASPTAAAAATPTPGGPISVSIVDFGYSPNSIDARAGQQVSLQVRNTGQVAHTFTITGVVDSRAINAGESKALQFTPSQAGRLTFFCTIHGQAIMSGSVNVTAGAGAQPDSPSGPAGGASGSSGNGGATPVAGADGY